MLDITTEKIIHILLEKDEPITSKQIAKEINMSLSTVKHNMRYVREYIESCGAELDVYKRQASCFIMSTTSSDADKMACCFQLFQRC